MKAPCFRGYEKKLRWWDGPVKPHEARRFASEGHPPELLAFAGVW